MHTKPLANCRIFYLEDDYFMATDTRETLVEAGAQVVLCASVRQALERIAEGEFDAALLDLNLDGEMSVPVARSLRDAAVPVVFLTGYSRDILPEDLNSCALLVKPADGPAVVKELEHQLRMSGAHDGRTGCARR